MTLSQRKKVLPLFSSARHLILCAAQMLCTTTSLCEQEAKHCVQEALGLAVGYLKNVVTFVHSLPLVTTRMRANEVSVA